jgi:hypothetical protein
MARKNPLFRNVKTKPNTFLEQAQQSSVATRPQLVQPDRIVVDKFGGGQTIERGGRSFKLSREEVKQYNEAQKFGVPAGQEKFRSQALQGLEAQPSPQEQEMINRQNMINKQTAMGRIAALQTTPEEKPIDWKQVGLSTITDPRTLKAVGTGIVGGALVGSPTGIGAIAGGGIGGIVGISSAIMQNIQDQKTDNIKAQELTLTDGKTNLNQIANLIQQDPENAEMYLEMYNDQLVKIAQAETNLRRDVSTNLNLALSLDGTRQLQRFENFYARGGSKELSDAKLNRALTMAAMGGGVMQQPMMSEPMDEERALMMSEQQL